MKVSRPMATGFAFLWVIVAYLIHPYLAIILLLVFIAALSR